MMNIDTDMELEQIVNLLIFYALMKIILCLSLPGTAEIRNDVSY